MLNNKHHMTLISYWTSNLSATACMISAIFPFW